MTVLAVIATTQGRLGVVLDELGVSGNELARRLSETAGWTEENARRYVRRWRSGRLPEIERCVLISEALDLTLDQLVGVAELEARQPDPAGMTPADQMIASGRAFAQRVATSLEQQPEVPAPRRKKKGAGQTT